MDLGENASNHKNSGHVENHDGGTFLPQFKMIRFHCTPTQDLQVEVDDEAGIIQQLVHPGPEKILYKVNCSPFKDSVIGESVNSS